MDTIKIQSFMHGIYYYNISPDHILESVKLQIGQMGNC